MAASVSVVELGFVQSAEPWRLRSPQFPSKTGGRPAWLGEVGLPGPEALQCRVCGKPLAFLLQVYAPCTGSFHRTIFLFCCRDPTCYQVADNCCFKVFRNQLPQKNDTYSSGPPPDSPPHDGENYMHYQLKCGVSLCRVCGCLAPKTCSKCHKVNYCSRAHQMMDWRQQHKQLCSEKLDVPSVEVPDHKFLFPEFEIVTEPEESDGSLEDEDSTGKETDMEMLTSDVTETTIESSMDDLSLDENELFAMAKHETEEDKVFNIFKRRIAVEPEQVLRYCRGGEPLWIASHNVPGENDIPNCECGAKRTYEFQVMPQLLNHLEVDSLDKSIDWGVLAVYTCSANCNTETKYAEEILWKQDLLGHTV